MVVTGPDLISKEEIRTLEWSKSALEVFLIRRIRDAVEREEYREAVEWRDLHKFLQGGETPVMLKSYTETTYRLVDLQIKINRQIVNNS